jgi:preprotein translocase subunit SecG
MAFLFYLIISVHVIACLFLIAVVLLQQGKGQDLASAFGGGGSQTAFGPRGSATVLSRATTILAAVFMITSLVLSVMKPGRSSVLDQVPANAAATPAPATPAEESATPATPAQSDESGTSGPAEEAPAPAEAPADAPDQP